MPDGQAAKLKSLKSLNFYFHQYIPENADWPEARDFFHQLFSHQFYTPYLFQETPLDKLTNAGDFVFKFYHANLMMPWLIRNFGIKPIFLIRNPYAVIASQLNFYAFTETIKAGKYKIPKCRYAGFFDQYQPILKDVKTAEEILAARWCLNFVPLIAHTDNNKSWLTISYESLLFHKDHELNRVFNYIGRPIPTNIDSVYSSPSSSTDKPKNHYARTLEHLNSWKNILSSKQVDNIAQILRGFGVKGYDQDPVPDCRYLYNGDEILGDS